MFIAFLPTTFHEKHQHISQKCGRIMIKQRKKEDENEEEGRI